MKFNAHICRLGFLHVASLACLSASLGAHAGEAATSTGIASFGVGVNTSSGNYGTSTKTTISSVPLTWKYDIDKWNFNLTVPYLTISGGTGVLPGVGTTANNNPKGRGKNAGVATSTASASGLGDIVAAVSREIYGTEDATFGVDLTGKVKFGTADKDKGLGTGENDYTALIDVYKTIDKLTLTGGLGYTTLGSNSFIQLKKNVLSLSLGGYYKIGPATSFGLAYDTSGRVSTTAAATRELTASLSHTLTERWKAQGYLLKGSGTGSPSWGGGASLAYSF